MANEHTEFWQKLLRFGDDENERKKNWNLFCIDQLKAFSTLNISRSEKEEIYQRYDPFHGDRDHSSHSRIIGNPDVAKYWVKQITSLRDLAEKHDGPRRLPDKREMLLDFESFMDFSDDQVQNHSFAGRILIGANFQGARFEQKANFEDSVFLGLTCFDDAIFSHAGDRIGNSFKNTEFHNTAYFKKIESSRIRFDGSTFNSAVYFDNANFESGKEIDGSRSRFAIFDKCQFNEVGEFSNVRFDCASFNDAQFDNTACFDKASFRSNVDFSNARFKNATSFRRTVFACPPKFYDAELHEDTDFGGVDWSKAEKSYIRPSKGGSSRSISIRDKAAVAARAWDRLVFIMSQREKYAERHEFFCLKMRAQRRRDGICLLSLANWLFDMFSGYGWSMGKAFGWWMAQMVMGAILIFCGTEMNGWKQFVQGFCLSFANAHAFLGLASTGGYLHSVRTELYDVARSDVYLDAIGAFQVVIGPIFLFLVLLTVRNRFRIR